jgi:hypothetical protein
VAHRQGNVELMEYIIGAAEELPEGAGGAEAEEDQEQDEQSGIVVAEGAELVNLREDERTALELSRLSPVKLSEAWTGRPAQKQVLVNCLHGRGFSREQRQLIAEAMDGYRLGELRFIVARFEPADAPEHYAGGNGARQLEASRERWEHEQVLVEEMRQVEAEPAPVAELFQLQAPSVKRRRRRAG